MAWDLDFSDLTLHQNHLKGLLNLYHFVIFPCLTIQGLKSDSLEGGHLSAIAHVQSGRIPPFGRERESKGKKWILSAGSLSKWSQQLEL